MQGADNMTREEVGRMIKNEEYLKSHRTMLKDADIYDEVAKEILQSITFIKAVKYDGMPKVKRQYDISDMLAEDGQIGYKKAKAKELHQRAEELRRRAKERKSEVIELIGAIKEPIVREMLESEFIQGKKPDIYYMASMNGLRPVQLQLLRNVKILNIK